MGQLSAMRSSVRRLSTDSRSTRLTLPGAVVAVAVAVAVGGCGAGTQAPGATSQAARPGATSSPSGQTAPAAIPVVATGPVVRRFSGARSQAIGSLSVKRSLVIRWNVARPRIQIYTAKGNLLVSSDRRTGTIRLGQGKYTNLRIDTGGPWTIQLRAAA
jgi:hypothetical protein